MKTLFPLLLTLLATTSLPAQICFDLQAEGRTLTVSLIAAVDYVNRPDNLYNSGLFTLSWPEAQGEGVIQSINAPSGFAWNYDSGAPLARLVNGRYYQKFSFNTTAEEDLTAGSPLAVMTIEVFGGDEVTGEFAVDVAPPAEIENGTPAITNVIDGNRYGAGACNLTVTGVVLPLAFLDFTARAQEKTALLQWTTGEEQGVAHQEIQRYDANGFVTIGKLAAGNQALNAYRFIDEDIQFGETYQYRIRAIDFDGTETISPIRSVNFSGAVAAYPNPADRVLTVVSPGEFSLRLFDGTGRIVMQQTGLSDQTVLDVSELTAGVYTLTTTSKTGYSEMVRKIVVSH